MTTPIIIISTGRTGTSFFSRNIGELYPEVAAYHERGFSRPIQILTNAYFSGLVPRQVPILFWKRFKEREIAGCEKPFHLDANCFLYGLFVIAPDLAPGIKVIHIIRDPRTYVTSHLNYSRFWRTSFIANYFVPLWQPNPLLTGKVALGTYLSYSRFQRYSWIWDFKNEVMESLKNNPAVAYLCIRFEDIFASELPEETFAQVTEFIGLPRKVDIRERFSMRVNPAPKDSFSEWPAWTPEQCRQLQAICGERMMKYGYGSEAAWQMKLAQHS